MRYASPPPEAAPGGSLRIQHGLSPYLAKAIFMNEQQTPGNDRETPVVKNVIQIGNGQLIAILGVFIAVAGFGFRAIDAQFDAVSVQFDAVSAQFDAVNARIDELSALMNARFDDVNRRIDDNTAELRLIRGDVNGLNERMTKVETTISIRPQAEVDGENNPIAASTPRGQG